MSNTQKKRGLPGKLHNLVALGAAILILRGGEDMAQGIPAPGSLTLPFFLRQLLFFWLVDRAFDRWVMRASKPVERFRWYALLGLVVCVIFFFVTWTTVREATSSGLPLDAALRRAAIWLACGVTSLVAGIGLVCCAWLGPRRDAMRNLAHISQPLSPDERDDEVFKRSSRTTFIVSMTLLFLVLPLIELLVLQRYPVWSWLSGGLIGLCWLLPSAYWSDQL